MAVHDWTRVEAGIFHMEYYRRKHKGALLHQHVRLRVEHDAGTLGVRRDKSDVGGAAADRLKHGRGGR